MASASHLFNMILVFMYQADHKLLSSLAGKMFLTDGKISAVAAKNLKVLLDMEEMRVKNNQGLALEGKFSGLLNP